MTLREVTDALIRRGISDGECLQADWRRDPQPRASLARSSLSASFRVAFTGPSRALTRAGSCAFAFVGWFWDAYVSTSCGAGGSWRRAGGAHEYPVHGRQSVTGQRQARSHTRAGRRSILYASANPRSLTLRQYAVQRKQSRSRDPGMSSPRGFHALLASSRRR